MFKVYLTLGFEHILDLQGYDHILFIIALCAIYKYTEWKRILVLVTAFTIGHSVTLALSALGIVVFRSDIIEFLIPLTIAITALFNVMNIEKKNTKINYSYIMALVFGWIHGLGFSNYFKALLGKEESIVGPLFAFNVGVELGQLIIVAMTMVIAWLLSRFVGVAHRDWTVFVSGGAFAVALTLLIEAKFW